MAGDKFAPNARWVTVVCLILLPLAVGCTQAASPSIEATEAEPSASPTTTLHVGTMDELPTEIAGIRPGRMVDADVVRLYGGGVLGGTIPSIRYYTDAAHQVTLRSGWHTDHMVVAVELTQGTALPPGVDPARTVTSLAVPVKVDKGIALGMTPDQVMKRLGEPQYESSMDGGYLRTLSYEVWAADPTKAGWISYNTVLEFVDGHLHKIGVYSGS